MREIEFRQPVFIDGEFERWHYWGFIRDGHFNGPLPPLGEAQEKSQRLIGLKDKHGKGIYEGDKVKGNRISGNYAGNWGVGRDYEGVVEFQNASFRIALKKQKTIDRFGGRTYIPFVYDEEIEIIGNIFESQQKDSPK